MPKSVQELNRTAATRALPDDPYGDDAGFIGKVIDWFNKIGSPSATAGSLTMDAVRLAIAGAGGRMGQALIEASLAQPGVALAAALDVDGSPAEGHDAGDALAAPPASPSATTFASALRGADVLIDFTRPEGTLAHVAGVRGGRRGRRGRHHRLERCAESRSGKARDSRVPIVCAANMSVGVVVLLSLVEQAAAQARAGLRRRDRRDAPPAQGRRAVGHGAAIGRCRRRRDGTASSPTAPCTRAKATRASARRAPSGSRRSAVATSSASTRWSSRAPASASSSSHRATSRQNFASGALRAAVFVAAQARRREDRPLRHAGRLGIAMRGLSHGGRPSL